MRLRTCLHAALLSTLIPCAAIGGAATSTVREPASPSDVLDRLMSPAGDAPAPGCSAAAALEGGTVAQRSYGFADLAQGAAIDAETVFHAASIAKQFTAFSIGLLAEDGRLSLQDSLRKHLPEMPAYAGGITLEHLIHHTSGLREQYHLLYFSGWRHGDVFRLDDVLSVLAAQRAINHPPGAEVVYGNSAYILLAEVVRRVSGSTLAEFAHARIFEPLGMTRTRFRQHHAEVVPGMAAAYRRVDGAWQLSLPRFDHYGSTNLLTTPSDLLRWQQNLMDGQLGGERLNAWMRRSGALADGTAIGYGGGLRLAEHRGLTQISHDGLDAGYRANALLLPERALRVAVLCNSAEADPIGLSLQIVDALLGTPEASTGDPAVVGPVAPFLPSSLAGAYWSPVTDELVRLEAHGQALRQIGTNAELRALGEGLFAPAASRHRWQFGRTAGATPGSTRTTLDVIDYWPTPRRFVRLEADLPDAARLRALVGRYRSEELGAEARIRFEESQLTLGFPRQEPVPMLAVGGDHFAAGFAAVRFTRNEHGRVEGMQVSTRRLRRLDWQRVPDQP